MAKTLEPMSIGQKHEMLMQKTILQIISNILFKPLLQRIEREYNFLYNEKPSLIKDMLLNGRIYYNDGVFYGNFNSKISKELRLMGASFDKRINGFRLGFDNIPNTLQVAIARSTIQQHVLKTTILNELSSLEKLSINEYTPLFKIAYDKFIDDLDVQFASSVTDVQKNLTIQPSLNITQREAFVNQYSENMALHIKNFTDKQIIALREEVQDNVFMGYRADRLKEIISNRFDVSESKAMFLARQESKLLLTKYSEIRYKDAGIKRYKWSSSQDERTRPEHRALHGKIISFDAPPVSDVKTGRRAHAGEDYGCRCVMIPVVE